MSSNEFAVTDPLYLSLNQRLALIHADQARLEAEVDFYLSLGVDQLELMRSFNRRLLYFIKSGSHNDYLGIRSQSDAFAEECEDYIHIISYALDEIYDMLDQEEEDFETWLMDLEHDGSGC
jgi:hypothetical protein